MGLKASRFKAAKIAASSIKGKEVSGSSKASVLALTTDLGFLSCRGV